MDIWFNNWKIRINEQKSKHVTFTLRKGDLSLDNKITIYKSIMNIQVAQTLNLYREHNRKS